MLINETARCLGLLDQQYWTRKGGKDFEGKESLKWEKGLAAINRHLAKIDKKVVSVADREADIFEFFKAERASSVELLVRVHQPRKIEISANKEVVKLDSIALHLKDFDTKEVLIQRNNRERRGWECLKKSKNVKVLIVTNPNFYKICHSNTLPSLYLLLRLFLLP